MIVNMVKRNHNLVNRNMNFLQNLTAQTTVVGTIAGVYITAGQST
jgi:hypothetical protein